jgi:hypothetical protein
MAHDGFSSILPMGVVRASRDMEHVVSESDGGSMSQTIGQQGPVSTSEAHQTACLETLLMSTSYHPPLVPPRVIVPYRATNVSSFGSAKRKERRCDLASVPLHDQENGAKSYSRVQLFVAECAVFTTYEPEALSLWFLLLMTSQMEKSDW